MKKLLTLTALGTVMLASNVYAAGFHLREQSAAAQGNAFAGATAGAENASYSYFNVAGLTRQKGTQLNLGATYIAPKAQASDVYGANEKNKGRGSDINNIVHASWAPNMNISYQINEKAFIGLGLNVPFGMITKYDRDWKGSDHGITSKVKAISATPMFAYKATDKLSLGAGLQMQYVKARLTNTSTLNISTSNGQVKTASAMEGEAYDLGYALGAMYEFTPQTRVGLAYRSEVKHKLHGDISGSVTSASEGASVLTGAVTSLINQDINARLTTPAMLSMGVYHEVNDKLALMAEYQRVFWSSFAKLNIRGEKTNDPTTGFVSSVNESWRDTNFYAIGASYQLDNQWKWRLGLAYDQSAVRLQHRTPRIPDSDRVWYSTGLNYQYSDRLSFDFAYTYIYAHDAHLDTELTGNEGRNATASYSNSVQLFGLSLNYKF